MSSHRGRVQQPARSRLNRVGWPADTYAEWREECEAVHRAYGRWTGSERAVRALAYAAYRAALDREEKAAGVYQVAAARLVGAGREPTEC